MEKHRDIMYENNNIFGTGAFIHRDLEKNWISTVTTDYINFVPKFKSDRRATYNYKNGKLHGKVHTANIRRYKIISIYKNGKQHGISTRQTESGMLISKLSYKNGFNDATLYHNTEVDMAYAKKLFSFENI